MEHAEALSMAFREVSQRVLPAVVSIETRTAPVQIGGESRRGSPLEEELFRRFFGDDFGGLEQFRQQMTPPRRGSGSGFVIDPQGVIMTNAHVVEGAEKVIVTLNDGRELTATEWVSDERSDVAIVRVQSDNPLPSVPLGDSDTVVIGDWVLALGNPFDIGTTVTQGIISAVGRNTGINERESYLQTDAAINPGNSGGPLVNLRGEVVGMNTAISTRSGGYDGVGFAIPVNSAKWVAEQLVAGGRVKRAFLGVQLQPISSDLRKQFGVPGSQGALVNQLFDGTPAQKAGVQTGDVVLEFAGQTVRDSTHLQSIVERLTAGQSYPMTVLRDGRRQQLSVTLEEMPDDFGRTIARRDGSSGRAPSTESFDELGLELTDLTPELAEQLSLDSDVVGVVVKGVETGSPADEAGLEAGDLIERVANQPVHDTKEFQKLTRDLDPKKGIVLLVRRDDGTRFVVLKAE
jgi:serine protease Do